MPNLPGRMGTCARNTFSGVHMPSLFAPKHCRYCGVLVATDQDALTDDVPAGRLETSRDAFDAHVESGTRSRTQREVYDYVVSSGGATTDEAEVALGLPHQTCSARMNDLKRAGLVTESVEKRKTRRGRDAFVYVAIRPWPEAAA